MGRSFDRPAAPVYRFARRPGLPPVALHRFPDHPAPAETHSHDFLLLLYLAAGEATLRVDGRALAARAGDAFVVAPGEVVAPASAVGAAGWALSFPPDVLSGSAFLSWRAHPLLYPFAGGTAGGAQRLGVPAADRPVWESRCAAIEAELAVRRDGCQEAVLAHLTLLLVDVSRLAADVVGHLTQREEPLLAAVFATIEARYAEPISLADVAAAVGLSAPHLTTVVRRRTGRTVQRWIAERRMAEARRLLAGTDLTVAQTAAAVGYRDAGYFIRAFRATHGVTPLAWRRAG